MNVNLSFSRSMTALGGNELHVLQSGNSIKKIRVTGINLHD